MNKIMQKIYFDKNDKLVIQTRSGIIYPDGSTKVSELRNDEMVTVSAGDAMRIVELINTNPEHKRIIVSHVVDTHHWWENGNERYITYESDDGAPKTVKKLISIINETREGVDKIYNRNLWQRIFNKEVYNYKK